MSPSLIDAFENFEEKGKIKIGFENESCTKEIPKERNKEVLISVEVIAILSILFFQGGRISELLCFFP